jgi:hypothetical protein
MIILTYVHKDNDNNNNNKNNKIIVVVIILSVINLKRNMWVM